MCPRGEFLYADSQMCEVWNYYHMQVKEQNCIRCVLGESTDEK